MCGNKNLNIIWIINCQMTSYNSFATNLENCQKIHTVQALDSRIAF